MYLSVDKWLCPCVWCPFSGPSSYVWLISEETSHVLTCASQRGGITCLRPRALKHSTWHFHMARAGLTCQPVGYRLARIWRQGSVHRTHGEKASVAFLSQDFVCVSSCSVMRQPTRTVAACARAFAFLPSFFFISHCLLRLMMIRLCPLCCIVSISRFTLYPVVLLILEINLKWMTIINYNSLSCLLLDTFFLRFLSFFLSLPACPLGCFFTSRAWASIGALADSSCLFRVGTKLGRINLNPFLI